MKRSAFNIFLLLVFGFNLSAQNWFEGNPVWYYTKPYSINKNCLMHKYIGDTIINDTVCAKVSVFDNCNESEKLFEQYFHYNDDSVYYYNEHYDNFFLLYNFAANIGDTIKVHHKKFKPSETYITTYDSISGFEYKILEARDTTIEGVVFKKQKIRYIDSNSGYPDDLSWGTVLGPQGSDEIIKGIGSLVYFLGTFGPLLMVDYFTLGELRCFSNLNNSLSITNSNWSNDCEYSLISETNMLVNKQITFSNVLDSEVNIYSLSGRYRRVDILSIYGEDIISENITGRDECSIMVEKLNTGVYLLLLENNLGVKEIFKLYKF